MHFDDYYYTLIHAEPVQEWRDVATGTGEWVKLKKWSQNQRHRLVVLGLFSSMGRIVRSSPRQLIFLGGCYQHIEGLYDLLEFVVDFLR